MSRARDLSELPQGDGLIRASTGILFGSDTAAANTLDDYEEGTCTLTVDGSSSSSSTFQYTKIGRVVTVTGDLDSIGSVSSDKILGLPFISSTLSYASVDVMTGGNYSSGFRPVLRVRPTEFRILKSNGNTHAASATSEIPDSVRFTITYFTNS